MPPSISQETRNRIITLHQQGMSMRRIARDLNISRNTVALWVNRYFGDGNVKDHRQNNGGVAAITNEQLDEMQLSYEQNGFLSTKFFAERFGVHPKTIRKHFHSMNSHHRQPTNKIGLKEDHEAERRKFARQYLNFDWSTTIFCDEISFKSTDHGHLNLERYDNPHYSEDHIANKESGCISTDMWGWMSCDGVGELVCLPPRANARNYLRLLEEDMLPTVRVVYPEEDLPRFNLVYDSCPILKAGIVKNWFRQHKEITVIQWPAKSADLNPIENIWGLMVERWEHRNERTPENVQLHCKEVWEDLRGSDICRKLVESMHDRLQIVLDNHGAYTRF